MVVQLASAGAVPQRALVTGATGFIGGVLARRLIAGGCVTTLLVRPGSDVANLADIASRAAICPAAVDDVEGIAAIVAAARPNVVFHLGVHNISMHRPSDIVPLFQSNVTGSAILCDAMVRGSCPTIVAVGSALQHGDGAPFGPVCLYAAAKQAMQDVFEYYAQCHSLRSITLKLFHAYGLGDRRPRLLRLLCRAAVCGETLETTEGHQVIDLTHVDDVVAALLRAADTSFAAGDGHAQSFSIASGRPVTVRQLADLVQHIAGRPLPIVWGVLPYKPREFFAPVSLGERLSGWAPRITLEQGIAEMIAAEDANHLQSTTSRRAYGASPQ